MTNPNYKKALKDYMENKATPKELAEIYDLDIDILRGIIEQQLLVEQIKKRKNEN